MGGSVRPRLDGYFVPGENGTLVVARVEVPKFWWFFDAFMLFVFFLTVGFSWYSVMASPLFIALLLLISMLPTWAEGPQAARLLRRLFSNEAVV